MKHLPKVAFALLLVLLGVGLWRFMDLRFDVGNVYPPLSTLRSDPLGGRVLFESLRDVPGLEIRQNFRQWDLFPLPTDSTVLLLGYRPDLRSPAASATQLDALLEFVENGGRLVLALPDRGWSKPLDTDFEELEEMELSVVGQPLLERIELSDAGILPTHSRTPTALRVPRNLDFPPRIPFRGSTSLLLQSEAWTRLYDLGESCVAARRSYGEGEILAFSGDYAFSNLALLRDRSPRLIAGVLGGRARVIFDENHHGLTDRSVIIELLSRYRLEGLVVALAVVFLLVVVRYAVPFLPPLPARSLRDTAGVMGAERVSSLATLLRRSTPPSQLLAACWQAWNETRGRRPAPLNPQTQAAVKDLLQRDLASKQARAALLERYHQMDRIINE
ncbi:MAG: DUF4350 domain-containing protein [Opitutales bacterium]